MMLDDITIALAWWVGERGIIGEVMRDGAVMPITGMRFAHDDDLACLEFDRRTGHSRRYPAVAALLVHPALGALERYNLGVVVSCQVAPPPDIDRIVRLFGSYWVRRFGFGVGLEFVSHERVAELLELHAARERDPGRGAS